MIKSGVININKPEGLTSQDVCTKLRRRLHIKRVGHTGTLDPMATGVLPVCFGKATRIIEYYDADLKTYEAVMQLGIVTDTLDRTGTVTERHPFDGITSEEIRLQFGQMTGRVEQTPPKYSALKVGGRRLYDYARAGEAVEIRTRQIFIGSLKVEEIDLPEGIIHFTVQCSKGTYIRTICDDIGRALGCGAVMTELTRTGSGFFELSRSVSLEEVLAMTEEELESVILPMEETLQYLGKASLRSESSVPFFRNGREIGGCFVQTILEPECPAHAAADSPVKDRWRIYDPEGRFLGISRYDRERDLFIADKIIME
ncbi:MAG: tRNA pseudouridine(55) synthase TruB [Mogibacterium sp.]|nr:tRNA pseudouridine(55) synthase TruB [Mogibacterium sp.]